MPRSDACLASEGLVDGGLVLAHHANAIPVAGEGGAIVGHENDDRRPLGVVGFLC